MTILKVLWESARDRGSNSWFGTRMAFLGLIILGLWATASTDLMLVPMLGLGVVLFEGFGFGRTSFIRRGAGR